MCIRDSPIPGPTQALYDSRNLCASFWYNFPQCSFCNGTWIKINLGKSLDLISQQNCWVVWEHDIHRKLLEAVLATYLVTDFYLTKEKSCGGKTSWMVYLIPSPILSFLTSLVSVGLPFSLDCIKTGRKCLTHMSKLLVFPYQNMLLLQI